MPALRTLALVFCSFLLTPHLAAAQLQLAGRVVDPQGRPVAGAMVTAIGPTSAPQETVTDERGQFVFPDLRAGNYDLVASAPGLVGETRVSASAAAAAIELPLRVSAVAETLIVSSSHIDQPLSRIADSVTVLTGQELEQRQTTTLGEALTTVPGFTVARSGGPGTLTSLFPRGGESDFTLVLVDGVRANAFGGGIDLSQVPLGDVDRVEVVRGPQSALYGADAIGGVVQIITRQGGAPTASALVEAGSRETRRVITSTTGSVDAFRWQAGADYFADEGFTGIAPASGEHVSNDDAEERHLWIGGGWRAARGTDLQGTFRYVDTDRGAPGPYGSDPAGRFSGIDRISRGSTERRAYGVRVVHPWTGPSSRVRQRVDFDSTDYDLSFLSRFGQSSSETTRTHLRVQTDAALTGDAGLSAGVEWLSEAGRSSFVRSGGSIVPVERRVVGTFAEARWSAHDRLSVQAGVRGEHITREAFVVNGFADDSVVSINPKVTVSWLVSRTPPAGGASRWTRVRAAAGTGIRPPDIFEIAFTDNPGLKPERSRSLEFGVTQALAAGAVQLEATTFANQYDDLIISVGSLRDVSRYRTDNVSNARARGVEIGAAWQSLTGVSARASYTFLDTEILAVDNTAQAPSPYRVGDWLLRRPRHSAALTLGWTASRINAFATLIARGETLDAEPAFGPSGGLHRNEGRAVLDIGGAWRLLRGVEVLARINNALDRDYEDVLGYPAPGRTGFVGVRLAARR